MRLKFTLDGQMPSGKNQIQTAMVRGRLIRFPNARFKAWREGAYQRLLTDRGDWTTLRQPALVTIKYYPGDLRTRDVPGMMDALCHLLEWCPTCGKDQRPDCKRHVVEDDKLLVHWHWTTMPLDRKAPRIEVEINTQPELK